MEKRIFGDIYNVRLTKEYTANNVKGPVYYCDFDKSKTILVVPYVFGREFIENVVKQNGLSSCVSSSKEEIYVIISHRDDDLIDSVLSSIN